MNFNLLYLLHKIYLKEVVSLIFVRNLRVHLININVFIEIIIIYTYSPFTLILAMYPLSYCACAHGLSSTQESL